MYLVFEEPIVIFYIFLQVQNQSRAKVTSQNLHQLATPALIPICQDVKPMTNILKVMHNVQFTMTRGATGAVHAPKPDKTPITWRRATAATDKFYSAKSR